MSNFKVNSKTSILEFKRKHNNLVENFNNLLPKINNAANHVILDNGNTLESFLKAIGESLKLGDVINDITNTQVGFVISLYDFEGGLWISVLGVGNGIGFYHYNLITIGETQYYAYDEINSKWFVLDDFTKVIANPTLAGTENALEGLQVGNTKYKIPKKTLYQITTYRSGTWADLYNGTNSVIGRPGLMDTITFVISGKDIDLSSYVGSTGPGTMFSEPDFVYFFDSNKFDNILTAILGSVVFKASACGGDTDYSGNYLSVMAVIRTSVNSGYNVYGKEFSFDGTKQLVSSLTDGVVRNISSFGPICIKKL